MKLRIFQNKNLLFVGLSLIVIGILLLIPTGFEGALQFQDAEKCKVLVLETDE